MELERKQSRSWRSMPIRPYLDGHKFDGGTTRQMGIAFEMALASLGATPGCDDPIRAALAQRIIALAQAGERDPERLCDGALRAVGPAAPSGGRGGGSITYPAGG
jgi:hypothetical protein